MGKLEILEADLMRIAIQEEIHRSEESRYDHRLRGVLLGCSGFSCYEVADLFGRSPRTVQYWVQRFEHRGFAGLQEHERSGRPSSLDGATLEDFVHAVSSQFDLWRKPNETLHRLCAIL